MKKIWYMFRIEDNLLDATVCMTTKKNIAKKIIKQNYLKKCDITGKDCIRKTPCDVYAELVGEKQYPIPNEIVEVGVIKRYRI